MSDEQPVTKTTTTVKASPAGLPPKVEVTTVTSSPLKEFGTWSAGLIGAFISGAAAALSASLASMAIDSEHFNIHAGLTHTLELAGATAVISGIISLSKYLTMHPIPTGWDGQDRRNS